MVATEADAGTGADARADAGDDAEADVGAAGGLRGLFASFHRRDLPYVVPRKYEELPGAPRDGDVDLFVRADRFDEACRLAEDAGFVDTSPSTARSMVAYAARNPATAAALLAEKPGRAVRVLLGEETVHKQGYENRKLERGGVVLDVRNHVAYVSPADGSRIRVDPAIERRLYDRRRRKDGVFIPSPIDELAHVVPHCVFDKGGSFSGYYVERCDELVETVTADPGRESAFRELLRLLFFDAADLVYDLLVAGAYDEIRERLYRFDAY